MEGRYFPSGTKWHDLLEELCARMHLWMNSGINFGLSGSLPFDQPDLPTCHKRSVASIETGSTRRPAIRHNESNLCIPS